MPIETPRGEILDIEAEWEKTYRFAINDSDSDSDECSVSEEEKETVKEEAKECSDDEDEEDDEEDKKRFAQLQYQQKVFEYNKQLFMASYDRSLKGKLVEMMDEGFLDFDENLASL